MTLRERIILALTLVLTSVVFVFDAFVLTGTALPAAPYFVAIIIAAYFLAPRAAVAVTVYAIALKLVADIASGTPIWLLVLYLLALGMVGFLSTNLSARMRREAALAEERQRLLKEVQFERSRWQATVDNMLDLVTVSDAEGRVIYINPAYTSMIGRYAKPGLSLEEHPIYYQLYHPDGTLFAPEDLPLQRAALRDEEVRDVEIVHRAADGRQFVGIFSGSPLHDENGCVVGAVAVGRDVTEQRKAEAERERAEEALRESERKYRNLFETMLQGVAYQDANGRITSMNPAAERILGKSPEEFLGETSVTVEHDTIREDGTPFPSLEHPSMIALRTGCEVHDVVMGVFNPREQRYHWISITAMPMFRQGEERPYEVYTLFADITDRKQATEERERLLAEVQQRAEALNTANKELEAFSYSVSHDLRAPLRHIDGFSRILIETYGDKLDEQGKQYLQFLRNGAKKMDGLIEAMLKLSRVTRAEMRRQPVNLSEMAESTLAEFLKEQPERQVELNIAPGVVADGDPQLLRIVLENLLGNAWKFTSKRPVAKIEFGVTHQDGKPVYYVRDNGAGFNMAYADKLFSAFQRLHREEEFPGTGIGLATVQRIIHRHSGRVWAEGGVDKGATFYFTLS